MLNICAKESGFRARDTFKEKKFEIKTRIFKVKNGEEKYFISGVDLSV